MVTLIVPTMNRTEFLLRLLQYYSAKNFQNKILVGDSSSEEEYDQCASRLERLNLPLDVERYHYPGLGCFAVTYNLIQKVTTPYAAFLPDDDFLVPESIEKMIDFMVGHKDYSSCWGKTAIFEVDGDMAYGTISKVNSSNPATNYSIEGETTAERLTAHVRHYTSVFIGVCQTDLFKNALRNALLLNETASMDGASRRVVTQYSELLTSFSLVAQGKVKSIDCLYWIRQQHKRRYINEDSFSALSMTNYPLCLRIMSKQLAEDIGDTEQAQMFDRDKFISVLMAFYIQKQLRRDLEELPCPKELVHDLSIDKSKILTDPTEYIGRIQRYIFDFHGKIGLNQLRSKSSRHYNEFKSVDEIVTQA